jgi:nucleoside-diphosphate-sugar epimerase
LGRQNTRVKPETTPDSPRTEAELEELLSRPSDADVQAMAALEGDILVLGATGKMGPTLARLAKRASDAAGVARRVIGVARFAPPKSREAMERHGIETLPCDVLDRDSLHNLPNLPNLLYLVGHKFGTSGDPSATWATNVYAAALAAERFKGSRIVAFSTGNVYPLSPIAHPPTEADAVGPVGEYAQSTLGRERMFTHFAARHRTKVALLRLNYAVEPRYGVLRDLADRIHERKPVDLSMGYVNVIWQRDANSVALRALAHAATPPFVLNLTGAETARVKDIAVRLGQRLGQSPTFTGTESDTALLSDASRCVRTFGPPDTSLGRAIELVADWVKAGGTSLDKPTHFEERAGKF